MNALPRRSYFTDGQAKASAGLPPAKDWPRCRSEPVPERDEGCPQGLEVIEFASTGRESGAVLRPPLLEERICWGWPSEPKRLEGLDLPLWATKALSPQTLGHSGPCLLTSFLCREQGGGLSSLEWARLSQ